MTPGKSSGCSRTRSAIGWGTSTATGTGWNGDPFQQSPCTAFSSPHVVSKRWIRGTATSVTRATRCSSARCSSSGSLASVPRSIETTHEVRFATSGRPSSSTISPRWGWTTISRIDCEAAWAAYSSPLTTCR